MDLCGSEAVVPVAACSASQEETNMKKLFSKLKRSDGKITYFSIYVHRLEHAIAEFLTYLHQIYDKLVIAFNHYTMHSFLAAKRCLSYVN